MLRYALINTIEAYLNCDGDYKKTATLINQHENTVRYRISKAKRFLNLENDNFKFIEQVSIALKIKNLLKL
jgi:DNA-binding PucR family transcriptional regulator